MFQDLKEIIELKPWLFHKLKLANVNAKQNTSLKILVVYYFQTCVFSLLILSRNQGFCGLLYLIISMLYLCRSIKGPYKEPVCNQ